MGGELLVCIQYTYITERGCFAMAFSQEIYYMSLIEFLQVI